MTKHLLGMIAVFLVLTVISCGGGDIAGKAKMEVAELGLSMYAPSGWRVERSDPQMCTKGDNTGIIMVEPLEGKVFTEHVQQLSEGFGGNVISSTPLSISGYDAVEVVIEYPNAGSKSIKVYIHKGDRLVEISFVTPAEDFSEYEPSLRESIATVTIE